MGEKDLETWTHLWQTEMETWGQEQNRWKNVGESIQ